MTTFPRACGAQDVIRLAHFRVQSHRGCEQIVEKLPRPLGQLSRRSHEVVLRVCLRGVHLALGEEDEHLAPAEWQRLHTLAHASDPRVATAVHIRHVGTEREEQILARHGAALRRPQPRHAHGERGGAAKPRPRRDALLQCKTRASAERRPQFRVDIFETGEESLLLEPVGHGAEDEALPLARKKFRAVEKGDRAHPHIQRVHPLSLPRDRKGKIDFCARFCLHTVILAPRAGFFNLSHSPVAAKVRRPASQRVPKLGCRPSEAKGSPLG